MPLLEVKKYTYEDLSSLPEGNYEIINGEKIEMTPTKFRHGKFEGIFFELLKKHLSHKGYVAVGEVGIIISKEPLRLRAADVVYVSKETSPDEPAGMLEIPPDLIIEIISEDNTASYLNEKVKDYLSIGVKTVVLVDPSTETVIIFKHGSKAEYYNFDEEFELIDGVSIRLKELLQESKS